MSSFLYDTQGDSVSESRCSVAPKDDQSESCSWSTRSSGTGIVHDALSPSNGRASTSDSSGYGSLQQHGFCDISGGSGSGMHGKAVCDRKRKERQESQSQGQEKKVSRSVSGGGGCEPSDTSRNGDFRRALSQDGFSGRNENLISGYTVEMVHI